MRIKKIDADSATGSITLQPEPQEKIVGFRKRLRAAFMVLRHGSSPGDYLRLTIIGNRFEGIESGEAGIEIHHP